jgi:hypothetical protein
MNESMKLIVVCQVSKVLKELAKMSWDDHKNYIVDDLSWSEVGWWTTWKKWDSLVLIRNEINVVVESKNHVLKNSMKLYEEYWLIGDVAFSWHTWKLGSYLLRCKGKNRKIGNVSLQTKKKLSYVHKVVKLGDNSISNKKDEGFDLIHIWGLIL